MYILLSASGFWANLALGDSWRWGNEWMMGNLILALHYFFFKHTLLHSIWPYQLSTNMNLWPNTQRAFIVNALAHWTDVFSQKSMMHYLWMNHWRLSALSRVSKKSSSPWQSNALTLSYDWGRYLWSGKQVSTIKCRAHKYFQSHALLRWLGCDYIPN